MTDKQRTFEEWMEAERPYDMAPLDYGIMFGVNEMAQHDREQFKLTACHLLEWCEENAFKGESLSSEQVGAIDRFIKRLKAYIGGNNGKEES